MDFEYIDKEDIEERAMKQIIEDLFAHNIFALETLKAGSTTINIFNCLFDQIKTKKDFMLDILENPYLVKSENDLLWIEDNMPQLSDLDNLESDDFFKAIENWLSAINIVHKKTYENTTQPKYLDLIDINLKIRDSLVLGYSENGVDSSIIKYVFNEKIKGNKTNKQFS